ncbi:MAG: hypothetical protein Q9169_001966 [Polycauliona sp. 2 TL-2023]
MTMRIHLHTDESVQGAASGSVRFDIRLVAMASNDPSRRASMASSSDMSPVDPAVAAKILPKKDKQSGPIKLKKSIAKNTRPKDSGMLIVAFPRLLITS